MIKSESPQLIQDTKILDKAYMTFAHLEKRMTFVLPAVQASPASLPGKEDQQQKQVKSRPASPFCISKAEEGYSVGNGEGDYTDQEERN